MEDLRNLIKEKYREAIERTTICKDFNMTIEEIEESQDFELCFSLNPQKTTLKVEVCPLKEKKVYEIPLRQDERDVILSTAMEILNCED